MIKLNLIKSIPVDFALTIIDRAHIFDNDHRKRCMGNLAFWDMGNEYVGASKAVCLICQERFIVISQSMK